MVKRVWGASDGQWGVLGGMTRRGGRRVAAFTLWVGRSGASSEAWIGFSIFRLKWMWVQSVRCLRLTLAGAAGSVCLPGAAPAQ